MNIVNSTQTRGSNLGRHLLVSSCMHLSDLPAIPPSPLSLTANWDFTTYVLTHMCLNVLHKSLLHVLNSLQCMELMCVHVSS